MKKTLIVIGVGLVIAVFALLIDSSPKPLVCDKFDLRAELKGGVLRFHIESDLPDDTKVRVGVSRSYKEKGNPEIYSMDYYEEKGTLGKWKIDQFVALNNKKWKRNLKNHQLKMSRLGVGFDVASISGEVELSAVVPMGQSNPLFGERNVYLSGKEVSNSGVNVVRKEVTFEFPIKEPKQGKSSVAPLNSSGPKAAAGYSFWDRLE